MNTERTSSTKPKGWLYAVIGALVLVIVGLSCWLISTKGDYNTLKEEKDQQKAEFQAEVDSLVRVHNELKANYGELSNQLAEKDSVIMANAEEIKQLLETQWDYNRVKRRVADLESVTRHYIHQLDSLYTVNEQLVAENERIREEVQEERKQNRNLQRQKDELTSKVNLAAVLRISNLKAEAVRFKGGSQETETDKARKAERVRVTFTVAQNDIVDAGSKVFYIRIADPSKNIICKGMGDEYAFMYQGELLQYTEKVQISYENREKNVRAYYIKPEDSEMQPGYYFVDIYDNSGNLVGQTTFNLR
ncbi:MAG: hypothetical protein II887_03505 [Bacteroidales bacterium]|nr:hypothetical protein [Bacteroidales bacterium]